MNYDLIASMPNWVLGVVLIAALAGVGVVSTYIARPRMKPLVGEGHNEAGGLIFATAGVIYAVVLAFLMFAVWEAYSGADQDVSNEAATLSSLAHDSQILPEPQRTQALTQLLLYTSEVINDEWPAMAKGEVDMRTRDTFDHLWDIYGQLRPLSDYTDQQNLLAQLSQQRSLRILDSQATLPDVFWWVLLGTGVVVIIFAGLLYMENKVSHVLMTALLGAMIAAMLWLILTLDHPFQGDIRVSPEPFQYGLQVLAAHAPPGFFTTPTR